MNIGEVTADIILPINKIEKEVEYLRRYFVECETDDQFQFFIQEYVREFQQHISQEVEVEDLIMVPDALAIKQVDDSTFEIAIACLFVILFFCSNCLLFVLFKTINNESPIKRPYNNYSMNTMNEISTSVIFCIFMSIVLSYMTVQPG